MARNYAFGQTDTLASTLAAAATSGTLTTGSFATKTAGDKVRFVFDYDVPAKREVIWGYVDGTALTSLVREKEGTSDVEHSAGAKVMIEFLPDHAKDLAECVNRKNHTSETAVQNQQIVTGFASIQGDDTGDVTATVNLPITFDVAPVVLLTPMGAAGSASTDITDYTTETAQGYTAQVSDITTSGFRISLERETGTLASSSYFGVTYIAIGTKA